MAAADNSYKVEYQSVQRRTANYKPNIWKPDRLQSLTTDFWEKECNKKRVQVLKKEVACMFSEANNNPLLKLELVDHISKLGLNNYFEEEIHSALNGIIISDGNELYSTALCFRLLRHYGHNASEEMFRSFVDEAGKFMTGKNVITLKALIELFEASNMGKEEENILKEARLFTVQSLSSFGGISHCDLFTKQLVTRAMRLPWQWGVAWYNVKKHINAYEKGHKQNTKLIELSKLNFNLVQALHQEDLKDVSRWWINLGINKKLNFSRDRIVESFLFAAGVASGAQHGSLRKWMTKVIKLILIIDDVYDIYGSLEELECFTNAVEMWSPGEVKDLPECIKICFWALFNTTQEIAVEIQQEKGWTSVLPNLHNKWADFCKALLLEAKWYHQGYTPSLEEYLENGWTSSSGPLLALLTILGVEDGRMKRDVAEFSKPYWDITYHSSLIIRLCNDQGTSAAELERGDAASSILCYMREANVTEEAAREHIKSLIIRSWRKINGHSYNTTGSFVEDEPARYIINIARAAHFIYQNGDGFGVQDGETRDQVLLNLIEPLQINQLVDQIHC
ncbi:OLC1v1021978C2 [Oldenlandia corymbosa var. corymbosa]|nr:OLC1v1021978C2 [Oldenlandia corymbosa var. corymbosa]